MKNQIYAYVLFSFLTVIFLGFTQFGFRSNAQTENVWAFGVNAGIDFNTNTPTPIRTGIDTREGCASTCDTSGQLLFYTDGTSVWDRGHNVMANGSNLTGANYNVTHSTTQGALIVPMPDVAAINQNKYYVFSLGQLEPVFEESFYLGRLYYSIVDMSLNNGLGAVTTKGILLDTFLTEHMTAVTGNNCNVWLLVLSRLDTTKAGNIDLNLKAYNIDINGIDANPVISPTQVKKGVLGSIVVSSDRTKVAIGDQNLVLYNFDPEVGDIKNPLVLSNSNAYGVCFSPDNSKLYSCGTGPLVQFDLSYNDPDSIIASRIQLAPYIFSPAIKKGPDDKLYVAANDWADYLHVIKEPNIAGIDCQFQPNGFRVLSGTQSRLGLPNAATIVKRRKIYHSSDSVYSVYCADNLILKANNLLGSNYVWEDGTIGPERKIRNPGTYWVSYQNNTNCILDEHVDTFEVHVKPIPSLLNINPSCKDLSNGFVEHIKDVQDTNTYQYQWRLVMDTIVLSEDSFLSYVGSGDYQVYISGGNSCDTTLYFHIPEEDYKVSFASDTLICEGDEVFFLNQSDTHFEEWYWSFGDENTSTERSPSHIFTDSGTYTITLIGTGKICTDTIYRSITVDAPVSNISFSTDKKHICLGESISFYPRVDISATGLVWDFGSGNRMNGPNEHVQHGYDISGTIPITLTARFRACPDIEFTDTITVHPLPLVDLGSDSVICLHSAPIRLSNTYPHEAGYKYQWSTGAITQDIQVRHHGLYKLTITNDYGCSSTESIRIDKDCYLDIPNAFTPNGDGMNDYFFPRQYLTEGVKEFRFQIFNRWGQIVFETTNTDGRGWDGLFNGREQPMGVYIYTIELIFENDNQEKYNGNITLLR